MSGCRPIATDLPDHTIDFLDGVSDFKVGVIGRQLEFQDQAIHLVDDKGNSQSIVYALLDDLFSVDHDTFHYIDDESNTIRQASGSDHFVQEIGMT